MFMKLRRVERSKQTRNEKVLTPPPEAFHSGGKLWLLIRHKGKEQQEIGKVKEDHKTKVNSTNIGIDIAVKQHERDGI